MKLKDKIAIVTGSSSGIGAATAVLLAKEGANVVVCYKNNKQGAESTAGKILEIGGKAIIQQANLENPKEVRVLVENVVKEFGRIDILVNNAGGYIEEDEWNGTTDVWLDTLKQNLISVMNISREVISLFVKQKSGIVVNIASRHSIAGHHDAISYGAAKAGIVNVTQSYAKVLAPYGRANVISPSGTRAGYWIDDEVKEELEENIANTPLGRLIEPDEIANLVLYLVSDDSAMITGQNIHIDAGDSLRH